MIRKLKSGEFRIYSRHTDAKTGKRKNLGDASATREKAEEHERAIQYFKRHFGDVSNRKRTERPGEHFNDFDELLQEAVVDGWLDVFQVACKQQEIFEFPKMLRGIGWRARARTRCSPFPQASAILSGTDMDARRS